MPRRPSVLGTILTNGSRDTSAPVTAPLETLDAAAVHEVVRVFARALEAHRENINRLNVYPVPDGDTGTNMALTMASVLAELDGIESTGPGAMGSVCKALSHGSLMGARGNSGVILSQIIRGLSAELSGVQTVDAVLWARAMTAASDAAYGAVMRPVEGTILTVVRESAEAARVCADGGGTLVEVLAAAQGAGAESLARTPELLPVLAEAGVVDSGGTGYTLLLDALLNVVDGRPIPEPTPIDGISGGAAPLLHAALDAAHSDGGGVADLRYEVMFLLDADDGVMPAFKDVWATMGDSIVAVGGEGLWNCHIHTNDIGASIEAAVDIGRPRQIRVTDLTEQVEEERWVREAEPVPGEPATVHEPVPTAVVAVGMGDGIRRIFFSLGVQVVVEGGQTMNPSTAQLLEAVESAPADEVVILPNNKNIIPVAQQVDANTGKTVHVVPTVGVAEGFAALLAYDPQSSGAQNARTMVEAADGVVAGEVTRAVRDSTCDLGSISTGDWMGICADGIVALAPSLEQVCTELLDRLVADEHEMVTIIEGDGASDAATRHIELWLADNRPGAESEVHHGGQPLYPYLFGIE